MADEGAVAEAVGVQPGHRADGIRRPRSAFASKLEDSAVGGTRTSNRAAARFNTIGHAEDLRNGLGAPLLV